MTLDGLVDNCFTEYRTRHPHTHVYKAQSFDKPEAVITSLDSACIMPESVAKLSAKQVLTILGATFIGGATVELSASLVSLKGKENEAVIIVATQLLKIACNQLFFENVNIIVAKDTVFEIKVRNGIATTHGLRMLQSARLRDCTTPIEKYVLTSSNMAELVLRPFDFNTSSLKKFKSFIAKTFTAQISLVMVSCENVFFKIGNTKQAALMRTFQHFHFPQNVRHLPTNNWELYEKIKKLYRLILCMPFELKEPLELLLKRIDTLGLDFSDSSVQDLLKEIRRESNEQPSADLSLILDKLNSLFEKTEEVARIYEEMIVYYVEPPKIDVVRKARLAKDSVRVCETCRRYESTSTRLKTCSLCLKTLYCSQHCQGTDWPHHKNVCVLKMAPMPK